MICFIKTGRAFIPELTAYFEYLQQNNIKTVVCDNEDQAREVDATLYYRFGGFLNKEVKKGIPEIHEYHSISTGKYPRIKNIIKSIFSVKPVGHSFLNEKVEKAFLFRKNIPIIYRDMGVSNNFLKVRSSLKKEYDIVYAGSISNRNGVVDAVISLAKKGYKIALIGNANEYDLILINKYENIDFFGRCNQDEIINIFKKSKCGFNYVPDEYPMNIQTATKVLEYLVSGMPIISNSYSWINEHANKNGYKYIKLDNLLNYDSNLEFNNDYILNESDVECFLWDCILDGCDFIRFIKNANTCKK